VTSIRPALGCAPCDALSLALFHEYRQRGVECHPNEVSDTPWGTREFALYDPDRNALTFCRDLTSVEKERRSP
jgi:hypothetical protein